MPIWVTQFCIHSSFPTIDDPQLGRRMYVDTVPYRLPQVNTIFKRVCLVRIEEDDHRIGLDRTDLVV